MWRVNLCCENTRSTGQQGSNRLVTPASVKRLQVSKQSPGLVQAGRQNKHSCLMLARQLTIRQPHAFASSTASHRLWGLSGCIRQYRACLLPRVNSRRFADFTVMSNAEHQQDWQQDIPYQLASEDKKIEIKYTASCMCGQVQYAVDCDPVAAKYCHCKSCQRLHGTLPALHVVSLL